MSSSSSRAQEVERAYARYARIYDWVFGPSLAAGRRLAVRTLAAQKGEKVLEIGVGTGLSLSLYASGVDITGVDLSEPMLERARLRAQRLGLACELQRMDAQALSYADASFDHCVAMYVASVAPKPEAIVEEMRRVTRPGGTLVLVNHFSRRGTFAESLERLLQPFAGRLGWEPLFYLDEFQAKTGTAAASDLGVPPFGYWRVLAMKNEAPSA